MSFTPLARGGEMRSWRFAPTTDLWADSSHFLQKLFLKTFPTFPRETRDHTTVFHRHKMASMLAYDRMDECELYP